MSLDALFCPRWVAVVGSTAEGKIGYELIKQIVDGGFERVAAVNPKAQGVFSAAGYRSVAEVPGPVDLVVVASPAATVAQVLEESGQAGVRAAVVITSGFAEIGNRAAEEEILAVARRHGMRMVGPNCAGILNTHHRLNASLETRPPAGKVALISQSGAMGGAVLSWAEEQGVGFSKFLSYGNRADLDEADLLAYLAEDAETEVVALYIESIVDGRAFLQAVAEFSRRKPLVVIKSGRGQAGQRAALSHTGSMAGADAVYDAALRSAGALRVAGVEELFDLCRGFVALPPVKGRRLAIVSNSGGPGVLAADRAEEVGLTVPEPSPALRERLQSWLPPYASLRNPIDLTVEGTEAGYRETLVAMLEEYDAALAVDVNTPYLDSVALARGVADAAQRSGKPVVASFMAGRVVADGIAHLRARGLANFPTGERAVAVLARMAEYDELRIADCGLRIGGVRDSRSGTQNPQPPLRFPVLEPDGMAWLAANGIPVPRFAVAANAQEAVAACRAVGYPAVMKVVSPDIVHKSERGGVRTGLRDDAAAAAAFEAIRAAAAGCDFRGVIVYPMIHDAQEVLVGISRDAQFGPVVAFGLGGVYTEILRDVVLRVAPVSRTEAARMIREIRGLPILQGARGRPSADLDALADLVAAVSELPFRHPEVAELDLNPVFALAHGALVGDVRVLPSRE